MGAAGAEGGVMSNERLRQMNEFYNRFIADKPLVPNGDVTEETGREVWVICTCGANYRTYLKGTIPIPSREGAVALCPQCNTPIQNARSFGGHSGDVFNAWIG